jgi:hypothetical protein
MNFTSAEKLSYLKSLMWDYDISPEDCLAVLEGRQEKAGHYTESTLFRKMIETLPWFTIIRILSAQRVLELLTDDVIRSLRFSSLTKRYVFVRDRLQQIV